MNTKLFLKVLFVILAYVMQGVFELFNENLEFLPDVT